MGKIVVNTLIFDGRYNVTAPSLHMCFACVFRPAGSVKWEVWAHVRPRHNSVLLQERILAILSLHFSFERQIVMLGKHSVSSSWETVT